MQLGIAAEYKPQELDPVSDSRSSLGSIELGEPQGSIKAKGLNRGHLHQPFRGWTQQNLQIQRVHW